MRVKLVVCTVTERLKTSIITIMIVRNILYIYILQTFFQYVTEDLSGNKNFCAFSVTVKGNFTLRYVIHSNIPLKIPDTQPPVIDFCESPPDFITITENVDIEWDEPLFHDNSREPLTIKQSHKFGRFPFGQTFVSYVATDSAGNSAACDITIKLASEQ